MLFYKKLMEESNLSYGTVEHLQRELHPAFEMALRDCIIRTNPTHNVLRQLKKQTIVALGAGSITKRVYQDGRIERCDNVKDVKLYIENIEEMIERKQKLFAEE